MIVISNTTFVKYPGGKHSELPIIKKFLPSHIANYYEPFVGGGAVYFNITAKAYLINDKSTDLIRLYKATKEQDKKFFDAFEAIDNMWNFLHNFTVANETLLSSTYIEYRDDVIGDDEIKTIVEKLFTAHKTEFCDILTSGLEDKNDIFLVILQKYYLKKMKSMKSLEKKKHLPEEDIFDNLEGALKAGFYMYIRQLYNTSIHYPEKFDDGVIAALYAFIRETAYSSMFRFNLNGDFNVPYGGKSYNNKDINARIMCYKNSDVLQKLGQTTVENLDFEEFMQKHPAQKDDFLFIDPPYDSEFSEYDKSKFEHSDQKRLADYLINICEGNFMVVIKNTDYIQSLYSAGVVCKNGNKLAVYCFDKKYMVSFMNRNNKDVEHILITNYPIGEV